MPAFSLVSYFSGSAIFVLLLVAYSFTVFAADFTASDAVSVLFLAISRALL